MGADASDESLAQGARRGLPRALEVPFAAAVLVVLSPVLSVAALAVKLSSPGPVLFRQRRLGRGGGEFELVKLRTMRQGSGGTRFTAAGDARITRVGRVLRRSKLDELPGLWNVLRGDMSLVGPRPEVTELVDLDDHRWREVLSVRPGITDPVTLELRNEETLLAGVEGDRDRYYRDVLQPWKLEGYVMYLRRRTAWSDLSVLARTAWRVVAPRRGGGPKVGAGELRDR